MSLGILTPHTGTHGQPRPPLLRRLLSWRKPGARPATVLLRRDGAVTVEHDGTVTVRPVNGRTLGTQPRRQPALPGRKPLPGRQPWQTAAQPALPAPAPSGPARPQDPGDGLGPDVPIARPYAPQPVYGEAPQLDVAEAERLAREMLP